MKRNAHTLSIVAHDANAKKRKPIEHHDASIAWQGRVQFLVPANSEITDMGGDCIVVPMGNRLELHVTNVDAIPELDIPQDRMVQGLLTIRRGLPRQVSSMTLQIDTADEPTLEFRLSQNGPLRGSLWSKPVPGARLCILRAQKGVVETQIAA